MRTMIGLLFLGLSFSCASEQKLDEPQPFEVEEDVKMNVDMAQVEELAQLDMGGSKEKQENVQCEEIEEGRQVEIEGERFVLHDQSSTIAIHSDCAWSHYENSNISYSRRDRVRFLRNEYYDRYNESHILPEKLEKHYQQQTFNVGTYLGDNKTGYEGGRLWVVLEEPLFESENGWHAFECTKTLYHGIPDQLYVLNEHYVICNMNTDFGLTLNSSIASPTADKVWSIANYISGWMTTEQRRECKKDIAQCPSEIAWKGRLIYLKNEHYISESIAGFYYPEMVLQYVLEEMPVELAYQKDGKIEYTITPRPLFNLLYVIPYN